MLNFAVDVRFEQQGGHSDLTRFFVIALGHWSCLKEPLCQRKQAEQPSKVSTAFTSNA